MKVVDGTREILSLTSIGAKLDKLLERANQDPVCHFDARGFEAHQHGESGVTSKRRGELSRSSILGSLFGGRTLTRVVQAPSVNVCFTDKQEEK